MLSWNRKMMFPIKVEFWFHDTIRLSTYFTLDRPIQDIIGNFRDIIRKPRSRNHFFYRRKRSFIIRPSESLLYRFFFCKRKDDHIRRLIISEMTILRGEEFSPFSCTPHVLYNFWYEYLVFFSGILLI